MTVSHRTRWNLLSIWTSSIQESAKVETVGVRLLRWSFPSPDAAATPLASMMTSGSRP